MVVRDTHGDVPTVVNLFTGLSWNKMIDTLNNDRYTIMLQMYVSLYAPPTSVVLILSKLEPQLVFIVVRVTQETRLPGSKFG